MTKYTFPLFVRAVVLVALFAGGLTIPAHAQTSTSTAAHPVKPTTSRRVVEKKVVTHRPVDRLIEGTFADLASSTYTITDGTTTYTVDVQTKRILNKDWKTVPLSDFKSGDTVRAFGTITGDTMTAVALRDVSLVPVVHHIVAGVVSDLQADAFTLTAGKVTYSVHVSTPKVLDRVWRKIAYKDIEDGNTVRVFGVVASSSIDATILRDVSLPKVAVKTTKKTIKTHA